MSNKRVEKILAELKRQGIQGLKDAGEYIPESEPIYDWLNEIVTSELRYFFYEVVTDIDALDDKELEGLAACMMTSYCRICVKATQMEEIINRIAETKNYDQ